MAFSRRVLERRQRREEKRRQAELERRQVADLEQQQDEERREAARLEAEARDAQFDEARARREATLERLRAQKLAERRAEAERTEHRDALLEILRAARQRARQTALDEIAQRTALRQRLLEARRAEQQQAEQAQARRTEALQARLAEQRAAEQEAEVQATQRQAALRSRLAKQRSADRAEERRETARRAQQAEQRESERAEVRQAAAQREAARKSRQAERREAEQDLAQSEARRELAARARRDQRQDQDEATQRAAAHRSTAREARLAERREAEQAEARREAARQTGRADQHTAERAPTRRQSDRAVEREARRAAAESAARRAEPRRASRATPAQIETPTPRDPLQDRVPSGTLSGALPWLRVVGNRLVTLAGDPVTLRGLSLLGLERAEPHPQQGFAAGAGITAESFEALLAWGVNVVRVAFNRSRVLNGYGDFSAWDYLSELDGIIHQAANRGAYTLLSLRQLDDTTVFGTRPGPNGERLPNYIAPQPDYDTIGMWRVLGERYADEPAVLFDLYTAPHPPLPDDLTGYDSDWDLWTLWVQMMVAELRRLHPRAICWVSGLAEATDLSGFPILGTAGDPIPNLVYAAHLYPRRANPWPALQALARTQAVFVTEWGGERGDLAWGERTALALRGSSLGWTAAHWNAEPLLAARPSRGPITPTPFGAVVQRALALAGERLTVTPPVLPAALNTIATR